MNVDDAVRLIAPVVVRDGRWADLGAGSGTFAAALARLLGPRGMVYAVERDTTSVVALEELARRGAGDGSAPIVVRRGDFNRPLDLPVLDGVLLANALHFVVAERQSTVLELVAQCVVHGGAILVIEYDNRPPSRWVPFPISLTRLGELARVARLGAPEMIGRRESGFGGTMYVARLTRPAGRA